MKKRMSWILPGLIPGRVFRTLFEGLPTDTETVVLAKEAEDNWKVAGYLIR